MNKTVIYVVFTILMPVALLLIFLEKRARRIMLSFICGVLVCFLAYCVNTLVYHHIHLPTNTYALIFGPIIEEILKFIPLLLFSLILRKGKRQTIAMSFA